MVNISERTSTFKSEQDPFSDLCLPNAHLTKPNGTLQQPTFLFLIALAIRAQAALIKINAPSAWWLGQIPHFPAHPASPQFCGYLSWCGFCPSHSTRYAISLHCFSLCKMHPAFRPLCSVANLFALMHVHTAAHKDSRRLHTWSWHVVGRINFMARSSTPEPSSHPPIAIHPPTAPQPGALPAPSPPVFDGFCNLPVFLCQQWSRWWVGEWMGE